MVMEPKVLLLDEPLSNLDARLRLEMRAELQRVQRASGITMIFVTHDQAEALALADRIVVMLNGAVEQIGTPEEIYDRPQSAFVADFVGFENVFALEGGKLKTPGAPSPWPIRRPAIAGLAWRPGHGRCSGDGPFRGTVRGDLVRRQHARISARHAARADQGGSRRRDCRPRARRRTSPSTCRSSKAAQLPRFG